MVSKGIDIFNKYKILIKNFGYLTIIKAFNLILPLVIFPYLLQVLGATNYGFVVFAESIVAYFVIFIGFGFALSATKEASIHRDNPKKLNEIVSNVYTIKGILFFISVICVFCFSNLFFEQKEYQILLLITMHLALYEFLFPFWFFQGIEKMKYITYLDLINRSFFVVLILAFIKSPDDFILVPTLQSIGSIISIILSFYILYKKENIRFVMPSISSLTQYTKESLLYFTSTISIQIFTNSNRFLIGSFIGVSSLAYYDIVEKIIKILSVPTTIFRTVLIPYVNKTKDKKIVRTVTKIMTLSSVLIIIGVWLFANQVIYFLTKEHNLKTIYYLKLYSVIILFYNLSNYYLVVSINAFGYQKLFMKMMLSSVVLYSFLILIIFFNNLFFVDYFILTLIIVELFIVCATYYISYKKKLL
ncbi:hypothetical protein WH52_13245 [Tenacibaculum holothuriorum]|uniref:Polysaccharide biosynthesis protein n=1 Tax=Tenacibaculum holothuriorum TaxID=1635173 RepID=A0A1Y2P9A5_9FLAO|nr:oligosaccharide flippase family protein [Tenacibaculum holothuriorum]OSY87025.1 hypothetical protein WH52_13245 [Tenacibaculum holothuriorum]